MSNHDEYLLQLLTVLQNLRDEKEKEGRSERARSLAIVITDMEKLVAYYEKYVVS